MATKRSYSNMLNEDYDLARANKGAGSATLSQPKPNLKPKSSVYGKKAGFSPWKAMAKKKKRGY